MLVIYIHRERERERERERIMRAGTQLFGGRNQVVKHR